VSLDATIWAWKVRQKQKKGGSLKPLKKLVLLSLADRASEDHCAYPSMARLVEDTEMDRKTVLKIIDELIEDGLIVDTGERKGRTKQVKVYQLLGVKGRETIPTTVLLNTEDTDLNSPNSGTVPITEQFQQFPERKDWLCSKKLREEITLADDSIEPETLMTAKWLAREKRAFEIYNQDKTICDELLNFYFADWLLHAYRTKYSQETKTGYGKTPAAEPKQLTDKQISAFAQKLAHHPEFASKQSAPGDSYEQLASRIKIKLMNPAQAKKWEPYLKQVGFTGSLQGAA